MKSLEELAQIRERMKNKVALREANGEIRIVVGMATCGIAAGARPVLNALVESVVKEDLKNVTVTQTGCIGMCVYEPIVEVYGKDGSHTTYVHVDPDKATKILEEHIGKGHIVEEYTVDAVKALEG